jgi:1,4-alpha-glucan branching enzyme
MNTDVDAVTYLQLANELVHAVNPFAVTIAEDMSGMPGMCLPIRTGGIGFDYRLSMGIPDFWIRLLKDSTDEQWDMFKLWYELTTRRPMEKNVGYSESHDQALVGGKTFLFQLADAAIYYGMGRDQHGLEVDRAVALHKMVRLATCALNGGAYLNFMGNEFGHPEWIDFPRRENGWSYKHARRLWSLRDNGDLRFRELADFDAAMVRELKRGRAIFAGGALNAAPAKLVANEQDKVLAFLRGDLMFVFNFNPVKSFTGYGVIVPPASDWKHLFDTDEPRFGGQGRIRKGEVYSPVLVLDTALNEFILQVKLYLPARSAIVLKRF